MLKNLISILMSCKYFFKFRLLKIKLGQHFGGAASSHSYPAVIKPKYFTAEILNSKV